jgi:hypothetical protein
VCIRYSVYTGVGKMPIEFDREMLLSLLPDCRTGMDGKTGEGLLSMTWGSAAEARAFFQLVREACADDPATVARFDELLKHAFGFDGSGLS